jgi:hypothetical protein
MHTVKPSSSAPCKIYSMGIIRNSSCMSQLEITPQNGNSLSTLYKQKAFYNYTQTKLKTSSQMIYRLLLFVLLSGFATSGIIAQTTALPDMNKRVQETLKESGATIRFMENKGQINNKDVLYYFEAPNASIYLEKNRMVFVAREYEVLRRKFLEDETLFKSEHQFSVYFTDANPDPIATDGLPV